jgi:uncharacterized protein with HEPN domain
MPANDRPNLMAIVDAIDQIQSYTDEIANANDFYENRMVFDATLMNFVLIGEMCGRISDELKGMYPEVEWQKIKDFRNLVAHDYLGIDAEEVWQIIGDKLVPLRGQIELILKDFNADSGSDETEAETPKE